MDERAAFERNIDENPLDATNHLVYADWLDENGEPDEAAFRRSMGEWVTRKTPSNPKLLSTVQGDFPAGVEADQIIPRESQDVSDPNVDLLRPFLAYNVGGPHRMIWRKYRHMEEAFRRAFMAGRKNSPQQMARAVSKFVRAKRGRR